MIPERIPIRIRIQRAIRGDFPFWLTVVPPGDYPCDCNRYGAVSVEATNGQMLGLRPDEFEVLEDGPNPALAAVREVR